VGFESSGQARALGEKALTKAMKEVDAEEEEEEEEEEVCKAKVVNEVDAERERATPRRRRDKLLYCCMSYEEEDTCISYEVDA
jgi:hypothetical protein